MLPIRLRRFLEGIRVRLQQLLPASGAGGLRGWSTQRKLILGAVALVVLSLPF